MKLGLTVSCGRDSMMNNSFEITISPQLPDEKPKDKELKFTVPPLVSAEDIAKQIAATINDSGGKASAKSHTVSTGAKAGARGKEFPTTTQVCLIEIEDLASMDIICSDDKVRLFDVGGKGSGGVGGSRPGGGLKPGKGTTITGIDCEEYRKKVEEKKKEAERKKEESKPPEGGPNPGTPEHWLCHPDWKWTPLGAMRGRRAPAIAAVVVGAADVTEIQLIGALGALTGAFMGPEWLIVPFVVIPDSLALQYDEIRLRLASAGVVTSDRADGVIEPLGFVAGHLEGEEIRTFGFITPHDPLGYNAFPWKIVVGEADAVAAHMDGTFGGNATVGSVFVPAPARPLGWVPHDLRTVVGSPLPPLPLVEPRASLVPMLPPPVPLVSEETTAMPAPTPPAAVRSVRES
jgi:hypothetical protein